MKLVDLGSGSAVEDAGFPKTQQRWESSHGPFLAELAAHPKPTI